MLWIGGLLGGDLLGGLVGGWGVFPSTNRSPFATAGKRCGVLHFRHLVWAACKSLKANAMPALADPGPLVTRVRNRTVANVDSIGFVVFRWTQCSAGKLKNARSLSRSPTILAAALGHFTPNSVLKRLIAVFASASVAASRMSVSIRFADGCCVLGNAARTFPALSNQHR